MIYDFSLRAVSLAGGTSPVPPSQGGDSGSVASLAQNDLELIIF